MRAFNNNKLQIICYLIVVTSVPLTRLIPEVITERLLRWSLDFTSFSLFCVIASPSPDTQPSFPVLVTTLPTGKGYACQRHFTTSPLNPDSGATKQLLFLRANPSIFLFGTPALFDGQPPALPISIGVTAGAAYWSQNNPQASVTSTAAATAKSSGNTRKASEFHLF